MDDVQYEKFIPTEEQLRRWEDNWVRSEQQFRDGTRRSECKGVKRVENFLRGNTVTYYRKRQYRYDGTTLVVDANDYPYLPLPENPKCAYPGCNGMKCIHGTIITNHKFVGPPKIPNSERGRKIVLPPETRLWAHGQSKTRAEHGRCRCFPKIDARVENVRPADSVSIQGYNRPLLTLRKF